MDALEFRHHLDGIIRYLREFDAKQALSVPWIRFGRSSNEIEESEKVRDCATSAVADEGPRGQAGPIRVGTASTWSPSGACPLSLSGSHERPSVEPASGASQMPISLESL